MNRRPPSSTRTEPTLSLHDALPISVDDPRIVTAMLRVPREAYLPESVARLAYRDTAVPLGRNRAANVPVATGRLLTRSEEHTSELQSLMRISYAVFCLKKTNKHLDDMLP